MKNTRNLPQIAFSALLLLLLIFSADRVRDSCFRALFTCGRLIIPSLFPFFVLSAFITKLGLPGTLGKLIAPAVCRIYGISPAGASALILGFVGGYPSGAAYIAALEKDGLISADEGERLVAFCNNSGPAFIIGVMGTGIFRSVKVGLCLYAVHIVSALLTGLLFKGGGYSRTVTPHRLDDTNTAGALVDSVKQAAASIINVCAFVLFFSVLVSLLDSGGFFSLLCRKAAIPLGQEADFFNAMFTGLLELGSGAAAMEGMSLRRLNLALAAGMLGWGGLSVHFQTLAVLSDSRIKGGLHLTGRLLSAIISFILMYLVSLI